MMRYKCGFLYDSGGIECGEVLFADDDREAVALATCKAIARHASLFGLHEVTGTAANGIDLIRPVNYAFDWERFEAQR